MLNPKWYNQTSNPCDRGSRPFSFYGSASLFILAVPVEDRRRDDHDVRPGDTTLTLGFR